MWFLNFFNYKQNKINIDDHKKKEIEYFNFFYR